MIKSLIEQLYDSKNCEAIKILYKTDKGSRQAIKQAIGTKLITDQQTIITANALDVIFLTCLAAKFADSEDECNRVAITVYQYHNKTKESIPSLLQDSGLVFANKCLISLAFYPQALETRWKRHAAPKPAFYRNVGKSVFKTYGQKDIAEHHELWEAFLGEMFV